MRLPGMLHGRVVRPQAAGARVSGGGRGLGARRPRPRERGPPGRLRRRGLRARGAGDRSGARPQGQWRGGGRPARDGGSARRDRDGAPRPRASSSIAATWTAPSAGRRRPLEAEYRWPFQMHASIGPSCGVADVRADEATDLDGEPGRLRAARGPRRPARPARRARARDLHGRLGLLRPQRRRRRGGGRGGALARGGPARCACSGCGTTSTATSPRALAWSCASAAPSTPRQGVAAWDYAVWTPTHTRRPGQPRGQSPRRRGDGRAGDGGAVQSAASETPSTATPSPPTGWSCTSSTAASCASPPCGASARRQNTFANESFVDELAAAAGADPVQFRLRHLADPRAAAVIQAAARAAGWQPRPSPGPEARSERPRGGPRHRLLPVRERARLRGHRGRGRGGPGERRGPRPPGRGGPRLRPRRQSRRRPEPDRGQRAPGDQPDAQGGRRLRRGGRDQPGLGLLSRSSPSRRCRTRWTSSSIDAGDKAPVGAGEPATCPIPAAIANAVFDATGARLRTVPFTPARVREELARA